MGSEVSGCVASRFYAVSVGYFTHFGFTVNFTHYVKTKPDSGFTVKSRTLFSRGSDTFFLTLLSSALYALFIYRIDSESMYTVTFLSYAVRS